MKERRLKGRNIFVVLLVAKRLPRIILSNLLNGV